MEKKVSVWLYLFGMLFANYSRNMAPEKNNYYTYHNKEQCSV